MAKCKHPDMLRELIQKKHPEAALSRPTALYTKLELPDGLVINIYDTGTVNFQGNDYQHRTKSDVEAVIDFINR